MHIPDGFLDGKTVALSATLAAGGIGVALWQTRRLPRRAVPLMGLSAAFVFAAQMCNFPIAGGTSGHLLGGTLTAVLLGPSAAVLVLTAVLVVQCFLFSDGGVLALGANVLNMGIVGSVIGYYIYRAVHRTIPGLFGRLAGAAFASWCGVVAASAVCAGQLALSGKVAASVAFPAMVGVHTLIGLGEAVITAMVIFSVAQTRPDLVGMGEGGPDAVPASPAGATSSRRGTVQFAAYGVLIALAVAAFIAPFASTDPDGLDRFAEDQKIEKAESPIKGPLPEYKVPGIGSAGVAMALGGVVGTGVVFGLSLLLAWGLVRRSAAAEAGAGGNVGAATP